MNLILYLLISFCLGAAGAWIISSYGYKLGLLDNPNERSSHRKATPKGGGIGLMAAFATLSLALTVPKSFWVPATLLALFSFWGERFYLSPKLRLPFQFAASIALLMGIFWGDQSRLSGFLLIVPLALFIVGTSNFYNFMDGINGIAGVTGVVGFGLIASLAFFSGADPYIITLSICISLSCLGFLPFNMPRAKVFMGDVGSIFLGFAFAGMVVWLSKSLLDFICFTSFLFPFYADEFTTMAVRIRDGENLLRPHRRHLYQLLANEKGISHWKVSVGYGLLQLVVGVTVLLLKPFGSIMILSILIAYFIGFTMVSFSIRKNLTAFV